MLTKNNRTFLRVVSLVTLASFLPSSVGAQNVFQIVRLSRGNVERASGKLPEGLSPVDEERLTLLERGERGPSRILSPIEDARLASLERDTHRATMREATATTGRENGSIQALFQSAQSAVTLNETRPLQVARNVDREREPLTKTEAAALQSNAQNDISRNTPNAVDEAHQNTTHRVSAGSAVKFLAKTFAIKRSAPSQRVHRSEKPGGFVVRKNQPTAAGAQAGVGEGEGEGEGDGQNDDIWVTRLEEARRYFADGNYSQGVIVLEEVLQNSRTMSTLDSADSMLRNLSSEIARGVLSPSYVEAVIAAMPAWENVSTAKARAALINLVLSQGRFADSGMNTELASDRYTLVHELAGRFLQEHTNDPLALEVLDNYFAAARQFGESKLKDDVRQLWKETVSNEHPMLRFAYRDLASIIAQYEFNNSARSFLLSIDLLADANNGLVDEILADESTYDRIKARAIYDVGMAYWNVGQDDAALQTFERVLELYPDLGDSTVTAAFAKTRILSIQNTDKPDRAASVLRQFLDEYPGAYCADVALFDLANVYVLADEDGLAMDTLNTLRGLYPASNILPAADKLQKQIETILAPSDHVGKIPASSLALAPWKPLPYCGPQAMRDYLRLQGIDSTAVDIAESAGLGEDGTSLEGLVSSAASLGATAYAFRAASLEDVPLPSIVHLRENHYAVLTEVSGDRVRLVSNGGQVEITGREEFLEEWQGVALAGSLPKERFTRLACEDLESIRGGQATFPTPNRSSCVNGDGAPLTCPTPSDENGIPSGDDDGPPSDCDRAFGNADGAGVGGGAGVRLGGGGHADSSAAGEVMDATGAVGSGITSREINLQIIPRLGAQQAEQTDFYVPIRGDLAFEFTRIFFNRWGKIRDEISPNDEVWSNNIGHGWFHNYNRHVVQSTNNDPTAGCPLAFVVVDATSVSEFVYADTDEVIGGHTHNIYTPATDMTRNYRSQRITRDETNGEVYLEMPSGARYHFSEPPTGSGADYVGRLLDIADQTGNKMELTYDGSERLSVVSSPQDPRDMHFSYDGEDRITKAQFKNGSTVLRTVSYEYDYYGDDLTRVDYYDIDDPPSYPDDIHNEFEYDKTCSPTSMYCSSGDTYRISTYIDKEGTYATFQVDYAWEYTGMPYPHAYFWRAVDNIAFLQDHSSVNTYYSPPYSDVVVYDSDESPNVALKKTVLKTGGVTGYLSTEVWRYGAESSDERKWHYYYNGNDDLTSQADPGQTEYSYTYTALGQVSTLRRGSSGPLIDFDYSGFNVVTRTDPNGAVSTYAYDTHNRIVSYHHPSMGSGAYTADYYYDAYGQLTTYNDALNRDWEYTYDAKGNMISSTDPLSRANTFEYNDLNQMTKATDNLGHDTYYEFAGSACGCAVSGRLTKIRNDNYDVVQEYTYTVDGNISTSTDALGHVQTFEYDVMHRVIAMSDGSGNTATYAYDKVGRVTAATSMEGLTSTYEYDFLGQVIAVGDGVGEIQFAYYDNGNVSQMTDGNGKTTSFYYWNNGGLANVVDAIDNEVWYGYDGMGHLTYTAAGSGGDIDSVYYIYNQGSSTSTGRLDSVQFINDNNSNTTYVNYEYDRANRLTKIKDWMGASTGFTNTDCIYEYDDADQLIEFTDFDSATLIYDYDGAGRLTSKTDYEGNETAYAYDNLDRVASMTTPGSKVCNYAYNDLDQVTSYNYGPSQQLTTAYAYDARHRVTTIQHKDGGTVVDGWNYDLDKDGNILRMASAVSGDNSSWYYGYDSRNRLVDSVRKNASGIPAMRQSYVYNAGDSLVTKKTVAFDTEFIDDCSTLDEDNWVDLADPPTWESTGGYLTAGEQSLAAIAHFQAAQDYDLWFSYYGESDPTGTLSVFLRYDDITEDTVMLTLGDDGATLQTIPAYDTLAENDAATNETEQWYDVHVQCDGPNITVWRAEQGLPLRPILRTTASPVQATGAILFITASDNAFRIDNVMDMAHRPSDNIVMDDFSGTELRPEWTATPTGEWSIDTGRAAITAASADGSIDLAKENANGEWWFTYILGSSGDVARLNIRKDDTDYNKVSINFSNTQVKILDKVSNAYVTPALDVESLTSTPGTPYDVYVKADNGTITVWRGSDQVASTSSASVLSGGHMALEVLSGDTLYYDNFSYLAAGHLSGVGNTSFEDNFSDSDTTEGAEAGGGADGIVWITSGSWSVAGGDKYVQNSTAGGDDSLYAQRNLRNGTLSFEYSLQDEGTTPIFTVSMISVHGSTPTLLDHLRVNFAETEAYIEDQVDNSPSAPTITELARNTDADSDVDGSKYKVQVVVDGKHIEVWRSKVGNAAPPTRIFNVTTNIDVSKYPPNDFLYFYVPTNCQVRLDNIKMSVDEPGLTITRTDAANEMVRMTEDAVQTTFAYDAWGRTASKVSRGGAADYLYRWGDTLKRIDSTIPGEAARVAYVTDGNHKRRLRAVYQDDPNASPTEQTLYRWEGSQQIGDYAQGGGSAWDVGTLQNRYFPGYAEVPGDDPTADTYHYYRTDHLGSIRAIVDGSTKAVLAKNEFTPYGSNRTQVGVELNKGFTGHTWDAAAGQYYAKYRYYSPSSAKWHMRDPLGYSVGGNLFGYVGGNPTGFFDPLGLNRCKMRRPISSWPKKGPHTWIRVDTYDKHGKKNGTVDLHYSPRSANEDNPDWYEADPSEEPDGVIQETIPSSQEDDDALRDAWGSSTLPDGTDKPKYDPLSGYVCWDACDEYKNTRAECSEESPGE